MDPRQTPGDVPGSELQGSELQGSDVPGGDEQGQSSGDVLTMCLFGAMVIIASVCFVIW